MLETAAPYIVAGSVMAFCALSAFTIVRLIKKNLD
jgi:hypothetical protein